jgi:flagellar protein FliL
MDQAVGRIERIKGFIDRLDKRLERLEVRFEKEYEEEINVKETLKGLKAFFVSIRELIKDLQETKDKKQAQFKTSSLAEPFTPLKTFIVNLANAGGRRYLKVRLELELSNKEVKRELNMRLPEVRDQIVLVLSSKTYQQIQGVAGKTVLREELAERANSVLKTGKVKKIYFSEFVVQ